MTLLLPDAPAGAIVESLDRGGVSVTVTVPTYEGGATFTITVERDNDGDWSISLPWPDLDPDGGPYRMEAEGGGWYESYNGTLSLGAPDVPVERLR